MRPNMDRLRSGVTTELPDLPMPVSISCFRTGPYTDPSNLMCKFRYDRLFQELLLDSLWLRETIEVSQ